MSKFKLKPRYKDAFHFKSYWEKGNGKDIINCSVAEVSFKDFEKKSYLYYEIDELGDQVIQYFYAVQSFHIANKSIENYIRKGVSKNENIPKSIKTLFHFAETIPDWIDRDLLRLGAEACMKSGRDALISLRDYSLMGGYDYAYLNKPLVFTGALKKGALKRLTETLDFWINVTRSDAMDIHGKGYEFAIKTPLLHSYARFN